MLFSTRDLFVRDHSRLEGTQHVAFLVYSQLHDFTVGGRMASAEYIFPKGGFVITTKSDFNEV
ncbi:MAG: hypothetical protein JRN52_06875 [Nitrososphaerota archaeon]|nr:hypothetical protein [Nitrososphaerota archaeon]